MLDKMLRVLDILRMRCGYDCDLRWDGDEWTCHVKYIDRGPSFDYDVILDRHVLKQTPEIIAGYVIGECMDEMQRSWEHFEPADIDSDLGFDPYLGCITDEV